MVAPHVGAWIETELQIINIERGQSHPMWVRGLKLNLMKKAVKWYFGRTPCGCVD